MSRLCHVREALLSMLVLAMCVSSTPGQISTAPAQNDAQAGAVLGLTKENNALPLWSKADGQSKANLGKAAREHLRGVMLIGHPDVGHGTAWVISKKHRLLATNAHVADLMAMGKQAVAITNESTNVYKVERAWYHPGVRRFVERSSLSVRSTDPKVGPVYPNCPDLAVVQLSNDGPDLPYEFKMATEDEIASLLGRPTAIIGYPGHDTAWPKSGNKPVATLHDGVVSRITDFHNGTKSQRQKLQYTMATWGGFSGSPLFLPNGHVVGVHNMARTVKSKQSGVIRSIPHGVRIDCLWELLVHHRLHEKVPIKIDETKLKIKRWLEPDLRDKLAAHVKQLVYEADRLIILEEKYAEGVKKCSEAIKLVPDYAPAYFARAVGYRNYYVDNNEKISYEAGLKQLQYSLKDYYRWVQLDPTNPGAVIGFCVALNQISYHTEDQEHRRKALKILNATLSAESLSTYHRAEAHSTRGGVLDGLGNAAAALRDHNEAIRLYPGDAGFWETRGYYWQNQGYQARANADLLKSRQIRDEWRRNN